MPEIAMPAKLFVIVGCLALLSTFALAQSGGSYAITSSTIDGGGGTSIGGQYALTGSIGQPDASPQVLAGGQYQLVGGFWAGLAGQVLLDLIFEDGFETD